MLGLNNAMAAPSLDLLGCGRERRDEKVQTGDGPNLSDPNEVEWPKHLCNTVKGGL